MTSFFFLSSFFLELFLHSSSAAYLFLPFHTVLGVLKARMLKWFAIAFSSGPHSVRTLPHDPSILGGPTEHGSWFHLVRQDCGPCDQTGLFSVIGVFSLSIL